MTEAINAISELAANQGIGNVISLALIWVILRLQKNQSDETKQQNKLITQNGLNIAATNAIAEKQNAIVDEQKRNTDKVINLEDILATLIETLTVQNHDKNAIIESGIASLDKLDGSVITMSTELEKVLAEMAAMRGDMRELKEIVNQATSEIKGVVTSKTSEFEIRMGQLEEVVKKITQEPPIPKTLEPIPKKKPAPGVPVTPKPVNDTPKEKTE